MLPFGSITSLVPLSILAFAYLVYISASMLNKNIPESNKETAEAKVYASSGSETWQQVSYDDFRNHRIDTDDNIAVPDNFHFRDYTSIFFHEITYGELFAPQCVSPFSPRPPPAV
jgi:hypothetical protein